MLLDPSPRREAWLTKGCSDLRLVRHPRQARTDARQPAQGPLFHHDVHKLARHDNGLHDGFASHELLHSFVFKSELFEGGLVHVFGDLRFGADFSVYLENDFHGGFFGFGSVGFGPGRIGHRFFVSEHLPHFFGEVRCERLQEKGKYFAGFAVAIGGFEKFVVENHELAYRGVEAHVLDVARDLDDGLVHHLFDGFRSGFIHKDRGFIAVAHHGTPGAAEAVSHIASCVKLRRWRE